jgi:hypothetical protein
MAYVSQSQSFPLSFHISSLLGLHHSLIKLYFLPFVSHPTHLRARLGPGNLLCARWDADADAGDDLYGAAAHSRYGKYT